MEKVLSEKTKTKSILIILSTIVVLVLALFFLKETLNSYKQSSIYKSATDLLSAQKYHEAAKIFVKLGKYKDSESKLQETNKQILIQLEDFLKKIKIEMVTCPAGSFTMGSPTDEIGRMTSENLHTVILSEPFAIGKYEVTQAQYKSITGKNPSQFTGKSKPVEKVSWSDAKEFCEKLNSEYSSSLPEGYKFDLPTGAQWEYACRAGTTTTLNSGNNLTSTTGECPNLNEVAWYGCFPTETTHPVGKKMPNQWGIYDMHGNVWEWCRDWYEDSPTYSVIDPTGPSKGSCRIIRGGSWRSNPWLCRAAYRSADANPNFRNPDIGFRLALVPF